MSRHHGLLAAHDVTATPHRLAVLRVLDESAHPLTAAEVRLAVGRTGGIDRVTVYRILELLVTHDLVDRISSGDRSFRYGLSTARVHHAHPHFYCVRCGTMTCISTAVVAAVLEQLAGEVPGSVHRVELRLDGVCRACSVNGSGRE
ncbi:transcriptional repressor [bacterium]|nr:transcriptional repressor [candidate division CSSED10-310 bacterium]